MGNSVALNILNTEDMNPITSRLGNIAANEEVDGVAFDAQTVYVVASKLYAIETSNSASPVFLEQINALISESEFYRLAGKDKYFFTIGIDADAEGNRQGVMITMYYAESNTATPRIEHIYRLPLADAVWHDYTKTSAENFREAVASSVHPDTGESMIVLPVTYFNSVTRVESFFILSYVTESGFGEVQKITEFGFNSLIHAAIEREGYLYTFWDNVIRSTSLSNLKVVDSHEM